MIFDFNVHLNLPSTKNPVGSIELDDETRLDVPKLLMSYQASRKEFIEHFSNANFMLFNQDLPFGDHPIETFITQVRNDFPNALFTQLLDFRNPQLLSGLDRIVDASIKGIKYHSYVQKIADADIQLAVSAAKEAAKHGLFICIDASYGTTYMYEYDNMKLIAAVVQAVKNVPIIILHSGGARCFDALLLAEESENVYLETSFSLPYYEGSSIEDDYAFVYKKIGTERVLYASDFPAVELSESIDYFDRFIKKYDFKEVDSIKMRGQNALLLVNGLIA